MRSIRRERWPARLDTRAASIAVQPRPAPYESPGKLRAFAGFDRSESLRSRLAHAPVIADVAPCRRRPGGEVTGGRAFDDLGGGGGEETRHRPIVGMVDGAR